MSYDNTFNTLPIQIDIDDLKDKEKMLLLTQTQIAKVQQYFEENKFASRVSNKVLRKKFPESDFPDYGYILRFGNPLNNEQLQYFMVYRGKNKVLGEGTSGKAKVMQRLIPGYAADGTEVSAAGSWYTAKIPKISDTIHPVERYLRQKNTEKESELLKETGLGIGHIQRENKENYVSVGMKLIEGISLREYIDSLTVDSSAKKIKIALNILTAYQTQIKDKQLLHRDIKPDNIMVDPVSKKITFIDFGFAEKTQSGEINSDDYCGTPYYMAPEISKDKILPGNKISFNEKTEVYALGMTLYNLFFPSGFEINNIPELERTILITLSNMSSENIETRCNLAQCTSFFKIINNSCIKALDKIENIGLIKISEYVDANDNKKTKIIEAAKLADKVLLINQENQALNKSELAFVHQQLSKKGIFCENKVIPLSELELINKTRIKNYFLITISPSPKVPAQSMSNFLNIHISESSNYNKVLEDYLKTKYVAEISWDSIKESLIEDYLRITNKYNKSSKHNEILLDKSIETRTNSIVKTIKNLDDKVITDDGLSVYELHEQLVALQEKMFASSFLHYIKDWIFGKNTSKSAKMIEGLIEDHLTPSAA